MEGQRKTMKKLNQDSVTEIQTRHLFNESQRRYCFSQIEVRMVMVDKFYGNGEGTVLSCEGAGYLFPEI
jgi:hypothetical protein